VPLRFAVVPVLAFAGIEPDRVEREAAPVFFVERVEVFPVAMCRLLR
jgi:hypothetical protein